VPFLVARSQKYQIGALGRRNRGWPEAVYEAADTLKMGRQNLAFRVFRMKHHHAQPTQLSKQLRHSYWANFRRRQKRFSGLIEERRSVLIFIRSTVVVEAASNIVSSSLACDNYRVNSSLN
jgi:hypothetical protein